jgi:hypothetical protein
MKAILILLFFLAAGYAEGQKLKTLKNVSWLEGDWIMEAKKGNNYEEWKLVNENRMIGKGYTIHKKDTVSYEDLELLMEDGNVYYTATVKGQNDGKPVRFKMSEGNARHMLFENQDHDFPKSIDYRWKQNDRFHVELKGIMKGKKKTILYIFKKS